LSPLTAAPASGWQFAGWAGCTPNAANPKQCTITLNAAATVTATFTRPVLTVAKAGTGTGTVTGTGINCGSDCSEPYNLNTTVTLTATPASGSKFTGWSGACSGTGACTVSMSADKTVTATFGPTVALTVAKSGSGTVTSSPTGISCGSDCTENYASGAIVTLTAAPASGWQFAGWAGCTPNAANPKQCTITLNAAATVTATFTRPVLTVAKAGTGTGTVTGTGINCGSDCSEPYNLNTTVTLTATPASGSKFTGWSGACSGTGACTVSMSADKTVTAIFNTTTLGTYTPTFYKTSMGLGAVASSPVRDTYDPNPTVTLVSITSNESDNGLGNGDTPNDIQNAAFETDDRTFALLHE
jgi:hypothetical protein